MRASWSFPAAAVLLAACAGAPTAPAPQPAVAQPRPLAVKNAGFEDPARVQERCANHWSCTMHADPASFRFTLVEGGAASGARSLCIERVKPEPWAQLTQYFEPGDLKGRRLRFSVSVRTEGIDGPGVGPWAQVHGPQRPFPAVGMKVQKTKGWERHAIEFAVDPQAIHFEVGVNLEGGGRACVDDARLEVLP